MPKFNVLLLLTPKDCTSLTHVIADRFNSKYLRHAVMVDGRWPSG